MTAPLTIEKREALYEFLDASMDVWREVDALSDPGPYPGIAQSSMLRIREREAWEMVKRSGAEPKDLLSSFARVETLEAKRECLVGLLEAAHNEAVSQAARVETLEEALRRVHVLGCRGDSECVCTRCAALTGGAKPENHQRYFCPDCGSPIFPFAGGAK